MLLATMKGRLLWNRKSGLIYSLYYWPLLLMKIRKPGRKLW